MPLLQCTGSAPGEHDWVLGEITQLEEWHPSDADIPGLDDLRQRDPGAAQEAIEDRASYVFWKWIQSARIGQPGPLRKCANPSLLASGGHVDWARGAVATSRWVAPSCCGATWAARTASTEGLREEDLLGLRALVGVTTRRCKVVLAMARKSGATLVGVDLDGHLDLPALAALPLAESDSSRCDHCGAELADGVQTWVLEGVFRPDEMPLRSTARRTGRLRREDDAAVDDPRWCPTSPTSHRATDPVPARMAQLMAVATGPSRARSGGSWRCRARRWDIPREQVAAVIASPPQGDYAGGFDVQSPEWFLAGLVAAAMADGRIDTQERAMLEHACDALRLPRESIERLVAGMSRPVSS